MVSSIRINYWAVGAAVFIVLVFVIRASYIHHIQQVKTINLKELLSVSIALAELGGKQVAEVKMKHKGLNAEKKGETKEGKDELKTDGDMRSHRVIMSGFNQAFPFLSAQIVSEEHDKTEMVVSDVKPSKYLSEVKDLPDEMVPVSDVTVWVDPLDATQEYTEDLDQFVTVMICVAVKGRPVIGVINRPMASTDYPIETVWAWVGKKNSTNMKAATKSSDGATLKPRVIISRSHTGQASDEVKKAFGDGGAVIPAGGAGYKSIEVIRGHADLYAHVTLIKKWDICAGNALINAVGGQMKTLKNVEIDYSKEAPPGNEDGLIAAVFNFEEYIRRLGHVFLESQS